MVKPAHEAVSSQCSAALKEWCVVVKALEKGFQTVLLRKGGIAEGKTGFQVKEDAFLLYPTFEHQDESHIQPKYRRLLEECLAGRGSEKTVQISSWAKVSGWIEVKSIEALKALSTQYVWTPEFVQERFNWNPEKPMYALVVRVYRLHEPMILEVVPRYRGCRSWISLLSPVSLEGSRPVLDDATFSKVTNEFKAALTQTRPTA